MKEMLEELDKFTFTIEVDSFLMMPLHSPYSAEASLKEECYIYDIHEEFMTWFMGPVLVMSLWLKLPRQKMN